MQDEESSRGVEESSRGVEYPTASYPTLLTHNYHWSLLIARESAVWPLARSFPGLQSQGWVLAPGF